MAFDYDLFVIGGGSGGVRAARLTAEAGFRVGLAEGFRMGGTCVIRGCVPKKLMVYASAFAESFEDAAGFGWSGLAPRFDWAQLIRAKEAEVTRLEGIYTRNLEKAGVAVHTGYARLLGAHEVALADGQRVSAAHILIATGGTPFVPDIPGKAHAITSNEIFDLPEQPGRMAIIGGGYIACEFAGIMNGLGTEVTQIYRGAQILRGFDHDVQEHVAQEMRAKGIDIRCSTDVTAIERRADGLSLQLTTGEALAVDAVLYATGRIPQIADLGLEAAGVRTHEGAIAVDGYSQTNIPSIYAVGDVTNRVALTPVAIREGAAFVETVFHGRPLMPDHELIPTAVFTQPEIGTIGMSEEEAAARGPIAVYLAQFRPMMHSLSGRSERMLFKLITDRASDRVLGVHIIGHGAGEMIQMVGIAVKMGATKADFDRTMAVHPTAAEELVTMKTPARVTG